ncbi:hypothetical protein [Acinetobacter seifertii]|nr:hypothetical protein [Acinetobacter seifertii]
MNAGNLCPQAEYYYKSYGIQISWNDLIAAMMILLGGVVHDKVISKKIKY